MNETSKKYWLKRAQENDVRNQAEENIGLEKIQDAFKQAERELLLRIESYYYKYADKGGTISLADARMRLTPAELTAFRKEIISLSKKATTSTEKARLEALKLRVYISRQEALLAEIQHFAVELGRKVDVDISQTLRDIFNSQQLHQEYNLEQFFGYAVNFEKISPTQVDALIHQGYDGRDFSSKVWYDTEQLVKNLNVLLPQQFLLGRSTQDIARELARTMKTTRNSAERLIRTEGSHIAAQADMHTYKGAGIDTYEFLATLDGRTSEICISLDGMHFKLSEAQTGVNLPPMHQNCRSTTLPDVDMDGYDESRLAKGPDGKYVVVPKQTFQEWKHSK